MVHLIVGKKGKGKTKVLLDRVNEQVKKANGSIVYLDQSSKHMYELNNKIRLIDVSAFPISNSDEFVGFVCGILSQDHDLEVMYLDGFMKCAKLEDKDVTETIKKLDNVSSMFNIDFILSLSLDQSELNDDLKDKVLVAL
ncbi:MAG TPA: twitching motility protein PilT [Lachnospiraceae bacterium]|jgi:hypothetical protein|nr:twitching motility protein PilT [Lachnospiraceae bacterium]